MTNAEQGLGGPSNRLPGQRAGSLLLATSLSLALITGCGYKMHVIGKLDPERDTPLAPGSSVFIAEPHGATAYVTAREQIGKILKKKGFRLSRAEEADFYLLFDFGTREASADRSRTSISGTVFVHYFEVRLVEPYDLRSLEPRRAVWSGWAKLGKTLVKNPTDPLERVGSLLEAAFRNFPEDTGGVLSVRSAPPPQ